MEAGKLVELSLGQEPGELRLNLDGMAITIHLNNHLNHQKKGESTGEAVQAANAPPPAASQGTPATSGENSPDQKAITAELEYYRGVSREIYEGLGKLSKDINLSIQDLSLAEIIQTAMGSPGEGLDQARNQVTDVLKMTEQATMNIMELVDQIRDDCRDVQSKLMDFKESQPSEDLDDTAAETVMDSGAQELWDQLLSQAEEMDQLCVSAASAPPGVKEAQPSARVPVFAMADILQILLEFCTNEKVKQHLKAVQAKQDAIFRIPEVERAISLIAADTPMEDGFHQLPVEPLLSLLQSHCDDERVKDLLAKMASSADKLFPISALPLEAQEVEEDFADEHGDAPQGNPELATLWEKLHQNLKSLAEQRQTVTAGVAAPSGHQMGAPEVQDVLESVDRITQSLSRIVEALAFQDLSGQRLLKILKIIRQLQVQVLTLLVAAGHKLEMKIDDQSKLPHESDLARKELEGMLTGVAPPAADEEFPAVPDDQPLDQSAVNDLLTGMGF
jgi:chemotaxis regulatin CheY-phosphate phosphatase CheZ